MFGVKVPVGPDWAIRLLHMRPVFSTFVLSVTKGFNKVRGTVLGQINYVGLTTRQTTLGWKSAVGGFSIMITR